VDTFSSNIVDPATIATYTYDEDGLKRIEIVGGALRQWCGMDRIISRRGHKWAPRIIMP
jgi:hypothetical protein